MPWLLGFANIVTIPWEVERALLQTDMGVFLAVAPNGNSGR
jgi:hypothetical protein